MSWRIGWNKKYPTGQEVSIHSLEGEIITKTTPFAMPEIISKISFITAVSQRTRVASFTKLLKDCVLKIDAVGGWPKISGIEYDIHVYDSGQILQKDDDSRFGDNDTTYIPKNLRLEISTDYFDSLSARMLKFRGLTDEQILVHALGHETFHLSEITRGSECTLPFKLRHTGFFKAIRTEMNPQWKTLVEEIASNLFQYSRPEPNKFEPYFDLHALRAADIVSEACADLIGLNIFNKIYKDAKTQARMTQGLIDSRLFYEETHLQYYQTGSALKKFFSGNAGPLYPLEKIVAQTWKMALDELLLSSQLDNLMKTKIQSASLSMSKKPPKISLPDAQSSKPPSP
jgi:hypothetical protein